MIQSDTFREHWFLLRNVCFHVRRGAEHGTWRKQTHTPLIIRNICFSCLYHWGARIGQPLKRHFESKRIVSNSKVKFDSLLRWNDWMIQNQLKFAIFIYNQLLHSYFRLKQSFPSGAYRSALAWSGGRRCSGPIFDLQRLY